jgi:hypothetical protein
MAAISTSFNILNPHGFLNIKTVNFSWRCQDTTTALFIPPVSNTNQAISLFIRSLVPAGLITEPVINVLPPGITNTNGVALAFYSPGFFKFENVTINTDVLVQFDQTNFHATDGVQMWVSIIIETETID